MAHKSSNGVVHVFDITTFLWHARCFAALARPLVKLATGVWAVVSWRYPKLTFFIWLMTNVATVIVSTGYSLVLFILALAMCCALGALHHHTRIFIKLFPDHELEASSLQAYLHRSWGDEQKILEEYRRVLFQIDATLALVNVKLERMYNILKWDNPLVSFSVVIMFAGGALVLYFFELRVTIFAANNLVLLGNAIYLYICSRRSPNSSEVTEREEEEEEDKLELRNETKLGNYESDVDDMLVIDDEEMDSSESTEAKPTEGGTTVKHRSNVVKKLMELRRRQHQGSPGICCTGCQTSLMSILRRKYICCNCGNHFCSRCCSHKVLKSFLGVTAPSTKNDMVSVCAVCYRYLLTKNPGACIA